MTGSRGGGGREAGGFFSTMPTLPLWQPIIQTPPDCTAPLPHRSELVTDIQLGGVKEQEDEVGARRKPVGDLDEVVVALDALTKKADGGGWGGDKV